MRRLGHLRPLHHGALLRRQLHTPTAAALVIGDEILSGRTLDTNTQHLACTLFALGHRLARATTVPDHAATIASAAREMSAEYSRVFVSGGIGPTHDDVTYEAMVAAFGGELVECRKTMQLMEGVKSGLLDRSVWGDEVVESRLKMVRLPNCGRVLHPAAPALWVPVCIVGGAGSKHNVYVLPGVPRLFRVLVDALVACGEIPALAGGGFVRREIATALMESEIATGLGQLQKRYAGAGVMVGSYPKWVAAACEDSTIATATKRVSVVVAISGRDENAVAKCAEDARALVDGFDVPGQ